LRLHRLMRAFRPYRELANHVNLLSTKRPQAILVSLNAAFDKRAAVLVSHYTTHLSIFRLSCEQLVLAKELRLLSK
jgi:hypothetical protein